MPQESMSPRERWQAVLTRQKPDRVPMDYWSTPEFSAKLIRHLGLSRLSEKKLSAALSREERDPRHPNQARHALREALRCMHVDFVIHVGPKYAGPKLPPDTDVFGCTYRTIQYGTGEYSEVTTNPLARFQTVDQIEAEYRWPSPDWYDYSIVPQQIEGWEQYPIQGGGSEPFLIYKNLRGQEQAMMDLVDKPEIVHYCLDKLFELAYINSQRIYESIPGKVMLSYVAEDMGGQDNLMFSKKHIRTFLIPRMKRAIDLAHQAGAFVFHHNDGNCRAIIPDMIEAGIDALNPIQWRSRGMEREQLKAEFGDRLVFHGAVDNQYTLPFGSVAEVRQEVVDNYRILGAGGGYILAPCHNIQPVTPPENIVAMYETGYVEGWV
jgi:uroporphyrinogen decarboxylase